MRTLLAGVVGAGFSGTQHIDALRRLPGVEVVILAAGSETSAAQAARRSGVERWSADWRELTGAADLDVIHVCAPNHLHLPVALAALRAGKHVICEKPLALQVSDGEQLAAAAARTDRLTVLCHNYRFFAMVAELRARIASGDLGAVHGVHGRYLQDWLISPTSTNWRVDPNRGGPSRTVADIGTHWIDLAEVSTGLRLEAVMAQLGTVHPRRPAPSSERTFQADGDGKHPGPGGDWPPVTTEDRASLLLRFEAGVLGSLTLSQVAAGRKNDLELTVEGNAGSATWRQELPDQLWIGRSGGPNELHIRDPATLSPSAARLAQLPAGHNQGWSDALRNLLAAAYARIRGEPPRPDDVPLPTFADGVRHLAFVRATLESAREERWVRIEGRTERGSARVAEAAGRSQDGADRGDRADRADRAAGGAAPIRRSRAAR
ncbi:MAG: Gfo/Idh/MocA family oxidoreductase [Chloroflexota bacterium]|nr:Gfo/Idh/MocA family oxidoreductase [Chloroflexota bacterium]